MIAKKRHFLLFSTFLLSQLATACVVTSSSRSDDDRDGGDLPEGDAAGNGGNGGAGEDAGAGGSGNSAGADSGGGGEDAGSGGSAGDDAGSGGGGAMDGGGVDGGPVVELLDCGDRDTAGSTEVGGGITTDTTWSGTVHVTSDVRVSGGATLTIQPGTRVLVDVDQSIIVAWAGDAATLDAAGTPEEPIAFCGVTDDAGFWEGLMIEDTATSNSVLANALVTDAGGDGANAGLTVERAIEIDSVQVRNSASDGVHAADFRDTSARLSVEGVLGTAAVLTGSGAATRFPLGGTLTNNTRNHVEVSFLGVQSDTTFRALPVPYMQANDLRVSGGAELTFEAGVDYRFAVDTQLIVGWAGGQATLHVDGTAARPVSFGGSTGDPGHWESISIEDTVTSDSTITHALIRHGGAGGPVLSIDAPITLDNLDLDVNAEGVRISDAGLDPDSALLSITGTDGAALTVHPDALTTLPQGGTFTGNATDRITVQGGTYSVSGTVADLGVPYFLSDTVRVGDGAELDIAAGTEIVANADVELTVGWAGGTATFTAVGTESDPIVLRGLDDVNGYWRGVLIEDTVLSPSKLDFVEIHNAGASGSGGLRLQEEISVTNTTITKSAGFGLFFDDAFTTDYTATNTFSDNTQGATGTF